MSSSFFAVSQGNGESAAKGTEEEEEKEEEEDSDIDFSDDEEFMRQYRQRRMQEMAASAKLYVCMRTGLCAYVCVAADRHSFHGRRVAGAEVIIGLFCSSLAGGKSIRTGQAHGQRNAREADNSARTPAVCAGNYRSSGQWWR